MENRFNFRAWHKKYKKFYKVLHLNLNTDEGIWATVLGKDAMYENKDIHIVIQPKDCIVHQCTGLTDKNGKLIYAGDVVRILYSDWISKSETDKRTLSEYLKDIGKIGYVKYNNNDARFEIVGKGCDYFNVGRHGYIEIIGNVYENPELLKN